MDEAERRNREPVKVWFSCAGRVGCWEALIGHMITSFGLSNFTELTLVIIGQLTSRTTWNIEDIKDHGMVLVQFNGTTKIKDIGIQWSLLLLPLKLISTPFTHALRRQSSQWFDSYIRSFSKVMVVVGKVGTYTREGDGIKDSFFMKMTLFW
jgi:hypothetical protein